MQSKIIVIQSRDNLGMGDKSFNAVAFELMKNNVSFEHIIVPGIIYLASALNLSIELDEYDGAILVGYMQAQAHTAVKYTESIRAVHDVLLHYALPVGFCVELFSEELPHNTCSDLGTEAVSHCLDMMKIRNDMLSIGSQQHMRYNN